MSDGTGRSGESGERRDGGRGPGTTAVWAGDGTCDHEGATVPPVFHGVTFAHADLDEWRAVAEGRRKGHIYSRNTNPTVEAFEEKARALEGAPAATSFSTGMAAVSNTLSSLLSPGDRVVSVRDSYGGTNKIFVDFLPRWDVDVELCDTTDHEALEAAVGEGCDVLYLESPTNPTLKVVDLARLSEAARAVGATVVVDNTFATPLNQSPLELGADLVLHSATKFLGGHSDALGGVLCGPEGAVREAFHVREINGAALDAGSASRLLRGMKTLQLRVERQNGTALRLARWLEGRPEVAEVFYPGLPSHRGHEIARRQMSGYGGVLSFELEGGMEAVRGFLAELRLAHRAASLGSVSTLVGPPATTSHVELTAEERAEAGIPEGLIRYSVGIEDAEDLLADLGRGLEAL